MACRVNINLSKRTSVGGSGKKSISSIRSGGAFIARGSTSPNITRHIHCFHNKNNNSSAFASLANYNRSQTQLQNPVPQGWTLTESSCSDNVVVVTKTTDSISIVENSPPSGPESLDIEDMAGDIRMVDGKRTRRHWTLRDRSTMSVHFLKANLAEEGCEEAQLDVAKKLLLDSKDPDLLESAQKENSRLAIYWLVQSSTQGNVEATKLLKQSLLSGHGITAQNLPDVMTCVNTSTNEKLTYKAARLLYLKLNNGEKFITTTQLMTRINSPNKKNVHFAEDEEAESNNEDSLNSTFVEGDEDGESFPNVPLNETFTYQRPQKSSPSSSAENCETNKAELLQFNYLRTNGEGVKLTLEDLLKCASTFNAGESPKPAIHRSQKTMERHTWKFGSQLNIFLFQLLLLCALTQVISVNVFLICAAAFLSIWASFNLLGWKKKHLNFKDWSKGFGSIQHNDHAWSDSVAEDRLICNSLIPSLGALILSTFILFTLDGLNTLKLVTGCLASYALIRGISLQLPSLRMAAFVTIINFPALISLCTDYIRETEFSLNTQEYLNLREYSITLMDYLKPYIEGLDVSLTKDYIVTFIQFIAITSLLLGSRKIVLQKNLPELLVALWITKIMSFDLQHDILDLEIGLLAIVTIISVMLIVHSQRDFWKMFFSISFVLVVGTVFVTLISTSLEENPIRIAISSLRLSKDSTHIKGIDNIGALPLLSWDEYDMSCHRKAWKTYNPAATQMSCWVKYGKSPTAVRWRGRISIVKIREMSHDDVIFDILVNLIPPETSPESSTSWQKFLPGSEHPTEHPSPAVVLVSTIQLREQSAKQKTIDFVVNLQTGDKIEFHGILSPSSVGGLRPEIDHLQSIRCIECSAFQGQQEEFVLHHPSPHRSYKSHQAQNIKTVSTKYQTKDPINSNEGSYQSLFIRLKQLFNDLVGVVKNANFIFS